MTPSSIFRPEASPQTFWVTSLASREEILQREAIDHMITLLSPSRPLPPLSTKLHDHLVLRFDDVTGPMLDFVPAKSDMIEQLFDFADTYADRTILIHCYAGISRSTAAAYILAARQAPAGAEHQVAQALRAASPSASPNPLMVRIADAALGRAGKMSEAIAAIGRGLDAFEGKPFRFPASPHPRQAR